MVTWENLCAVLGVLLLAAAARAGFGRGSTLGQAVWRRSSRNPGRLESVDRIRLDARSSLHLIRFADRAFLVADHPTGCTLIEAFPWRDTLAEPGLAGHRRIP